MRFDHTITEQGSEVMVVPSLRPLYMILTRKDLKYGGEIVPKEKPYRVHWM